MPSIKFTSKTCKINKTGIIEWTEKKTWINVDHINISKKKEMLGIREANCQRPYRETGNQIKNYQ